VAAIRVPWRRANAARAALLNAASTYFTQSELRRAEVLGHELALFDACFALTEDGQDLCVSAVPDDPWLRAHVAGLEGAEQVWEVAAFLKVRRMASGADVVQRARSGELYDESYFTKRGGGAPYVGYPHEYNGSSGAPAFETLAAEIVRRLGPRSALDIGCATGLLVKALAERGVDAAGIDLSRWAVEHALTPAVVEGSAQALPWPDGRFDVALSQDFMEHVHPDDLPAVLAEQVRVVRPGGAILHLIPFYDTDPPVQVDAHLCQATRDWWMRLFASTPGVAVRRAPDAGSPSTLDRYVELERA
jgi:SAM-dependent methyltransferase